VQWTWVPHRNFPRVAGLGKVKVRFEAVLGVAADAKSAIPGLILMIGIQALGSSSSASTYLTVLNIGEEV
jgi:hypothetical protein